MKTNPDSKIAGISKRWTPALIKARGFTPVANYFLESYSTMVPKITAGEAMFIIHLLSFKWDEKSPFPSFTKLSSLMGVSPSATRLYARKLETKGYLERQSRDGKTSTFDLNLLFVRLEARWNASSYFEDSL